MTKSLSDAENAALGAIGGWLDVTLLQSTNYWKNAKQQQLPFTLDPKVLYRGYVANCLNNGSCVMMQFAFAGQIQKLIARGEDRQLTDGETVAAGFLSGYTSGFICGPIELAMIQQQRKGGSLPATSMNLLQGGPSLVTRGILGMCLREGIYASCFLGLMPVLRTNLKQMYPEQLANDDVARIAAALCGGPICSFLSHPPDTIKSCMQGDIEQAKFRGFKQTAGVLIQERGISSLWAGMPWRMFRQFCAVFIFDKVASDLPPLIFPKRD